MTAKDYVLSLNPDNSFVEALTEEDCIRMLINSHQDIRTNYISLKEKFDEKELELEEAKKKLLLTMLRYTNKNEKQQ